MIETLEINHTYYFQHIRVILLEIEISFNLAFVQVVETNMEIAVDLKFLTQYPLEEEYISLADLLGGKL
ncbi:hypothetical protein [Listeria booriae]|uniref:hypothetical protein n=1 Tax=Listeria booriae TaxID=1552123 RepID=UPI0016292B30|nr:hypothetical protein [Listeria booriae]MBC1235204.1 hypothetical protein [Listeria booriae]